MEIKKVHERVDGIKMVIIPKKSNIKGGEYVVVTNDLSLATKFQEEENGKRRSTRNKEKTNEGISTG